MIMVLGKMAALLDWWKALDFFRPLSYQANKGGYSGTPYGPSRAITLYRIMASHIVSACPVSTHWHHLVSYSLASHHLVSYRSYREVPDVFQK